MSEDIICSDLRSSIYKNASFVKDKEKREIYCALATNIDRSTVLNELLIEVSDVIENEHNKESDKTS